MTKGNFKLIEYNAGTNIGGWHLLRCVETYRDIVGGGGNLVCTPILEKFLKLVYQMTNNDKCNAVPSVNLLFVLDSTDAVEDLRTSLPFFKMALVELDLDISVFWTQSLDDVSVSDTGVFFHNKKMDVLSFPVFQFDYHDPKIEMMVLLHQQKKVVFPDMPAFLIAGYKSNFANLHWLNNCGKFDKSESAFINKFIPATYHLSDELNSVINQDLSWLYREVEQNKDNFVIKRDGYFGGDHVYVGRFMTDTSWRNILSAARKSKDWIVQQYCPSDHFYAPEPDGKLALHNYIFGFFNFGGDYGGAGVRLMKMDTGSGVVNSAKGAQYTSIFEVPAQSIFI
ncbi:hypothetical protein A5320_03870 [Rheinheimera sp. SA_1]|nr:hypothetical protein A5320_03870 [Rheinheimera sp. SA_1]